jgi:hypothetical protein
VIRIHQIAHTRSRIRNSVNRLGKESLVFGGCPDLIVSSAGLCVRYRDERASGPVDLERGFERKLPKSM